MTGPSTTSWIISALLHGGLVALLIFGPSLRPTVQPELPSGPVIEAQFVDPKLLDLAPLKEPEGPTPAEIARTERQRLEQEQADKDQLARLEQERQEQQERQDRIRKDKEKEDARIKAEAEAKIERDREIERQRIKELEDKKKEQERLAKEKADADRKERERVVAEEAERQRKAAEAQALIDAKKKQEEQDRLDAKKKADEEAKKEQARLKKIEDEKIAARKKKEAEELAQQLQREEDMRRMMGLENQRNEAVDNGLLAQYIAQIVSKVERNWNRPPSAKDDLSCTVRATQAPGGDVMRVEFGDCNGDAAVRRSIENAVNKASPLPEPADPTLFERNLVFVFEPK